MPVLVYSRQTVDIDRLLTALDQKREERHLSWRQLADAVGMSASTLTRMRGGANPDLENFCRLVIWLNVSADTFIARPARPIAPAGLLTVVSDHLKDRREIRTAAGIQALERLIECAYRTVIQLEKSTARFRAR